MFETASDKNLLTVTAVQIYKEKLLNDFSKILEKYFAAIDRTSF